MLMKAIAWILIGLVAGALAKLIMPGKDPGGLIVTILLGIAGSFIGGYVAHAVGLVGGGLIGTIFFATIGALILLFLWRMFTKNKRRDA